MGEAEPLSVDGIAYREATPAAETSRLPAVCLHGFPETSYMWRHVLPHLAESGRRAIAPDLPGFGDSEPDPPSTWERQVEAVERFWRAIGLERAALVVHDWGGLIGLRWACEHADAVAALVISSTGFFPDGKWNGMARLLRTPGEGEQMVDGLTREALGQMLAAVSRGYADDAADEYWKTFQTEAGRRGVLELYRSGDFEKLVPYEGKLAALGVPTLLLWGEDDVFAPVSGAHRFQREIPGAELAVIDGAGHFVYADEPQRTAAEVVAFLDRAGI
ncbi:MAG TPA: alpha/beta fold hydrolase [Solirubrobacterales bacterium]|nr:alpha/beta fold hydrolase [Solirubrobacterales bacterium]